MNSIWNFKNISRSFDHQDTKKVLLLWRANTNIFQVFIIDIPGAITDYQIYSKNTKIIGGQDEYHKFGLLRSKILKSSTKSMEI